MASKSWRCVVDACIARSAGESDDVTSTACRQVLLELRAICHRVVVGAELSAEYHRHMSRFFRKWLSSMAQKSKIVEVSGIDAGLNRAITRSLPSGEDRVQARKDLHLVDSALKTDRLVISRDGRAKDLFSAVANEEARLRRIAWVDPCDDWAGVVQGFRDCDRSGFRTL